MINYLIRLVIGYLGMLFIRLLVSIGKCEIDSIIDSEVDSIINSQNDSEMDSIIY